MHESTLEFLRSEGFWLSAHTADKTKYYLDNKDHILIQITERNTFILSFMLGGWGKMEYIEMSCDLLGKPAWDLAIERMEAARDAIKRRRVTLDLEHF